LAQCNSGQYLSNNGCKECPVGTYSHGNFNTCTPCQQGNYTQTVGSGNCTHCPEGKYCPYGAANGFSHKFETEQTNVFDQIETQKVKTNPQNIKLGSVVISFLLLTVPLFTVLYACFDEDFFKKLDLFYADVHYVE
jgi:hypothetical protein